MVQDFSLHLSFQSSYLGLVRKVTVSLPGYVKMWCQKNHAAVSGHGSTTWSSRECTVPSNRISTVHWEPSGMPHISSV